MHSIPSVWPAARDAAIPLTFGCQMEEVLVIELLATGRHGTKTTKCAENFATEMIGA